MSTVPLIYHPLRGAVYRFITGVALLTTMHWVANARLCGVNELTPSYWFERIVVSFAAYYYVLVMRFSDVYVMLSSQLLLVGFHLAYDRVRNGCTMTNSSGHIIDH